MSDDGEEATREGRKEVREVHQGGAARAAQRAGDEQTQREGQVPGKRRTVVEAISAGVTTSRRQTATAAVVLLAAALLTGRAAATVVVAKDFAALCDEADLIFVGTVTAVESRWSDPTKRSIETVVTFGDLTWLRGAARPSVSLRFGGGEMDGLHEEIAGVPHFAVGERRVIFAHDGTFVSPIVGFDQGALRVVEGSAGATVVAPDPTAAGAAVRLGATPDAPPAPVPLDEFLSRVRRQLAQPAGGTP
jgi:hypothetical protein